MTGIIQSLIASFSSAAAAAATDAYFYLVSLLLPGNGTNGAQNNTFLDSSSNNFTITRNGNTTQGTFTPFSLTGWSGNFNTSTTYLTVTDTANLRFGSGNFTIEAWVYRAASGAVQTIASKGASTPTGWVFQISAADKLVFTDTSTSITGATSLAANTWYYVAVVRAGTGTNQTTLYVNAVSDATGTSATNFNQTTNMLIGADRSSLNFANGYISNLRLSNTNRTISSTPTSPLSADSNTIFLSLNINRFQYTDSGGTYTSMAVTGTPSVQAFEPFAPGAAYSTSVVGGSGYFDGTGDYLSIANNAAFQFGTGGFSVEGWVYFTTSPAAASQMMVACISGTSGWELYYRGTNTAFAWYTNSALVIQGTIVPKPYTWYHVACTRTGTTTRLFVNGVLDAVTTTDSTSLSPTTTVNIGTESGATGIITGYLSNIRVVKGGLPSAYSTSSTTTGTQIFTPPTAPFTGSESLTAGSVSLLCNFTNGGIIDATSKNDLETVGNAQISTTQSKFGGSSMAFDGNGDSVKLSAPFTNVTFGTGDFTIEAWIYISVGSRLNMIYGDCDASTNNGSYTFFVDASNKLTLQQYTSASAVSTYATTATVSSGQWVHVCVSKTGTTAYLGINGTLQTFTGLLSSANNNPSAPAIGTQGNNISSTRDFNGYIDDFRITKGYARYTANFTAPTSAFPLQ